MREMMNVEVNQVSGALTQGELEDWIREVERYWEEQNRRRQLDQPLPESW